MSLFVGRSLSDDQTGAAELKPPSLVSYKGPNQDSSARIDEVTQELGVATTEPGTLKASEVVSSAATGGFFGFVAHLTPNHHS